MAHDLWSLQKWLGYLFVDEITELQRLTKELPDGAVVVNIGAGGGTSGLLFMEELKDRGYLYTIDIRNESSPFGCLEAERDVIIGAGLGHLRDQRWFQIHAPSDVVGKSWEGPRVDLLFIDGDHSYDGCYKDIVNWHPHVKIGGLIAVHDYGKDDIDFRSKSGKEVHPHPKSYSSTVDRVVDKLLVPNLEKVSRVESLIVFRKGSDDELD